MFSRIYCIYGNAVVVHSALVERKNAKLNTNKKLRKAVHMHD